MRALVVFESMYGNTETVARAIADGLSTRLAVDIVEVGAAPAKVPDDVDLLVVGGPTHAHGMSKPGTRQSAADKVPDGPVSSRIGVREWLDGLNRPAAGASPSAAKAGLSAAPAAGTSAAAFDAHIKGPHLVWGGAARPIAERLRRLGYRVIVAPEGFHVEGPFGPVIDVVADGETERARRWGRRWVQGSRPGLAHTSRSQSEPRLGFVWPVARRTLATHPWDGY